MKIESNNIVLTKNAKTINKNINKQGNNIVTNYKPITSLNTNELGIYKTLLRKNNLSFGVKRLNILAPNLNFDELLMYGMKYNVLLSKETLEDLRKQFIKRNKIITDYCLKFVSGEKLEDLDSDESVKIILILKMMKILILKIILMFLKYAKINYLSKLIVYMKF